MIHVAVGLVLDNDRVFVAQRDQNAHQGGLWEFPGGKVDAGETVEAALSRELNEELGIFVDYAEPVMQIKHDYKDKVVLLDVWQIIRYQGEPSGCEGQPVKWLTVNALKAEQFPAANRAIVDWLVRQFS
ncbi:MAG TPA: 8-oxo-dGTP diphosphatase MutT [Cellvibrionales bacterium]|nr:8-oxo-dGTP diphosphatase MutT [Cellvibrionales bacterium]